MDLVKISAALANKTRMEIMQWLKQPEDNFPPHQEVDGFGQGVCVSFIQEKAALSQPTISQYLKTLESAGLVISTRIGKWTYYKRNEEALQHYFEQIQRAI
ncbi:MAG: helix-turn-helix transcriptional regulator [Bacteroidota bacterium]